jgi:hypothetical protein
MAKTTDSKVVVVLNNNQSPVVGIMKKCVNVCKPGQCL